MFKDTQAYLLPTGIGGPRVKLFKTKLAEQGGAIANDESTATHVVVAESMEMPRLFKIIDPQKVSSSAKIVRCTWISDSLKAGLLQPTLPYELSRTVDSPERHDAPISKRVRHADASFISEASGSTSTAQAETGSLQPKHDSRKPFVSNNWVCATASEEAPVNRNSFITDQLQAMVETYQSTNDHWRALGYEKAIRVLKQHPSEITSREEARSLPNVGERLADKILEIIQQGKLQKLQEFQSQEKLVALNLFTKIWGSGPSTAEKWVQQGFRTLEELKCKGQLTSQQQIGLKHFDDFLEKMPRSEAKKIADMVEKAALFVEPGLTVIPCGSYRRGKAMCGDVDVIITHPDGKSHQDVLCKILHVLRSNGFLTDDLVMSHPGGRKYMGVCRLQEPGSKHRRLDIFVVPKEEFACSLLTFTGSAHFNRSMRLLARRNGMALNDHGLYTDVCRLGEEKITRGTRLPTPTEESVFEHLGLCYRMPEERDH